MIAICHLLFVTCSMLVAICYFLYVTCHMLLALCYLPYVTCSMMLFILNLQLLAKTSFLSLVVVRLVIFLIMAIIDWPLRFFWKFRILLQIHKNCQKSQFRFLEKGDLELCQAAMIEPRQTDHSVFSYWTSTDKRGQTWKKF